MIYLKSIFKFFTNRLLIIFFVFVLLFYVLLSRLYELQIVDGKMYNEQFEKSIVKEVFTKGLRGNIYDRNGFLLSENILAYDIYLNDSFQVEDRNEMIYKLVKILNKNGDKLINFMPMIIENDELIFDGKKREIRDFKKNIFNVKSKQKLSEEQEEMTAPEVFNYMIDKFKVDKSKYLFEDCFGILNLRYSQHIRRYTKFRPEKIANNVSYETVAALEENKLIFPGISIKESPFRIYNDGEYFSHIIGYTREIDKDKLEKMKGDGYKADDKVGVAGIEKEFEPYLRARDGYQKVEVNNLGETMKVLEDNEPIIGNNVVITLNHDLQIETYHILEQNLADILADNLYYKMPRKNKSIVLLKEVFDSIFRYKLMDIRDDTLKKTKTGARMVEKADKFIEDKSESVKIEIKKYKKGYKKSNESLYFFIFKSMIEDEYLKRSFYRNPYYDLFLEGKVSFYQLMQGLYDNNLLHLSMYDDEVIYQTSVAVDEYDETYIYDFEADKLLVDKLNKIIFEKMLKKKGLKQFYYLYIIDNEMISYRNLSLMIVELGLVSATEKEYKDLNSGRYSPLQFIKDKITALELKPKDLVLDPYAGSVVISDVKTGEVLALVSYPTYDNNRFVNEFDGRYYNKLRVDPAKPLYPRATMSKLVPGSTFKMATGLAALSEGVVEKKDRVLATGKFTKIFPPARCWIHAYGGAHGNINMTHAIEQSCNYYFYEMAYRMGSKGTENGEFNSDNGIKVLNKYIEKIGLSKKSGIEIKEAMPDTPKVDPVRGAIGQERNNYTAVGISRYINVLADGGKVKELNLVDKITNSKNELIADFIPKVLDEQAFKKEHVDIVNEGMLLVTKGKKGSARMEFSDFPIKVAGKTGTAQIVSFDDKSIDPVRKVIERPSHGLFAGFAPYDNPEISVVVVLQHGFRSAYAVDCAKDVLENYFKINKKVNDIDFGNELR